MAVALLNLALMLLEQWRKRDREKYFVSPSGTSPNWRSHNAKL